MSDDSTAFYAAIGMAIVGLPLTIVIVGLSTLWRAWWLYPTWAWYVVPLGAPAIAFWHFAALLILVSALHNTNIHKDERKIDWSTYVIVFLWPVAAWVILRWLR